MDVTKVLSAILGGKAGIDQDTQDDEAEMEEEEMDAEQKYKNWMANRPFLYDHLVVEKLQNPSLSLQWLPEKTESDNLVSIKHQLLVGTFIENNQQNYLNLYNVILPKFKGSVDVGNDSHTNGGAEPMQETKHSIKLAKSFKHEGEVNRLQYMPQNSKLVASRAESGLIYIFNTDHANLSGPADTLTGLTNSGFALNWSPVTEGQLLSTGEAGRVVLWNYPHTTSATTACTLGAVVNVCLA